MAVEKVAFEAEDNEDEFVDELKPGTELMLGQYTIEAFLNSGGFGITYLARDSLERQVVIKECFPGNFCRRQNASVLPRSRAHQAELKSIVRLFSQEAKSLARADHPNIVKVHQVFEENNTAYMALDFVDGRDLLDILNDEPPSLTKEQIEDYLVKLLDAIDHVHKQGILHRDISPDNILISETGEPVLIDFGAAREQATGDQNASRILSALRVIKDGYSPQEFYVQGSEQGPSCDLYSMAASFYHIITGDLPPDSQTRLSAYAAGDDDPYVPLSKLNTAFSKEFCSALDKAINILPKERVQSAGEWLDILNGKTIATPAGPSPRAKSQQKAVSDSSLPMVPILLGTTALVVIGAGALIFSQSGDEPASQAPTLDTGISVSTSLPSSQNAQLSQLETGVTPDAPEADAQVEVKSLTGLSPAPSIGNFDVDISTAITPRAAIAPPPRQFAPEVDENATALPDSGSDTPVGGDAPVLEQDADTAVVDAPAIDSTPVEAPSEDVVAVAPPQDDAELPSFMRPTAPVEPSVTEEPAIAAAPETAAPAPVEAFAPTGQLSSDWSVNLPFTARADDPAVIGNVTFSAWSWLKEGERIVSVNGSEISAINEIDDTLRRTSTIGDENQLAFTLGVQSAETGEITQQQMIAPVIQETVLPDGSRFETGFDNNVWRTRVLALAADSNSTLEEGDVLVQFIPTSSLFLNRTSLNDFIAAQGSTGNMDYPVLVSRDGSAVEAVLSVATPSSSDPVLPPAAIAGTEPEAPVETVVEDNQIGPLTISSGADVPFTLRAGEPGVVDTIADGAPFWLTPGTQIISVDGVAVTTNNAILAALGAKAKQSETEAFDVMIGVDARLSESAIERPLELTKTNSITLENGLVLVERKEGDIWTTIVASAPAGSPFEPGDRLVAYAKTGFRLDKMGAFQTVVDWELNAGTTSFNFVVQRSGEMWVKAFELAKVSE